MSFIDKQDAAFIDAFDREYREASLNQRVVELPEGKYQFVVTEMKIIEKDNCGMDNLPPDAYYDHMLVIQLRVLTEGAYQGGLVNKYHGICLANVRRIKGDLSALGHEFEGLGKLVQDIEQGAMVGLVVDGKVTKKNGKNGKVYTNVWLDRTVGRLSGDELGRNGFVPADDDDDLPWM